jgi:hypothetical protein
MARIKRQKKTKSISEKKERRAKAKVIRIAERNRLNRIKTMFHPDVIRGVKTIGEIKGNLS